MTGVVGMAGEFRNGGGFPLALKVLDSRFRGNDEGIAGMAGEFPLALVVLDSRFRGNDGEGGSDGVNGMRGDFRISAERIAIMAHIITKGPPAIRGGVRAS